MERRYRELDDDVILSEGHLYDYHGDLLVIGKPAFGLRVGDAKKKFETKFYEAVRAPSVDELLRLSDELAAASRRYTGSRYGYRNLKRALFDATERYLEARESMRK